MSCWLNGCPVAAKKASLVEPRAERGDLLARPPVVLLDRGAEQAVAGAQQHEGGHHAAHAHRGHLRQRHVLAHAADARDGIRPPGVGIALGPAGMRRHQVVGGVGAGDDPALPRRGQWPSPLSCRCPVQARPSHSHPPRPGPESTFPVLILRRAAAPSQFTSALRCALARAMRVGADCLGRSLRARASCPAGAASPHRIDAPRNRIDARLPANRGTCRLGAAFALAERKCSPRPGTSRRRGTSREPGGRS